jgi:hypothetical protein
MGWTGGYLLLAVFLGTRYGGNLPRIIGVNETLRKYFTEMKSVPTEMYRVLRLETPWSKSKSLRSLT